MLAWASAVTDGIGLPVAVAGRQVDKPAAAAAAADAAAAAARAVEHTAGHIDVDHSLDTVAEPEQHNKPPTALRALADHSMPATAAT